MTSRERAEAWGFWGAVSHGLLVYSYGGTARRGQRDFTYSPAAVAQVSSTGPLLYPYFYPLHDLFEGVYTCLRQRSPVGGMTFV
jgi:hypothetical protein